MSSIYIQEPPTHGKVLVKTSFGDIDIELWSREAPKACRNFVQLCMECFYDGIIFHRVVKKFIAQTGDPTGTGCTSVSVYGEPFKDEIHSRLRFTRRGLVALANNGKNDNGSQFFITLGATPELQGKHTIFGKIVGDTQYNILKLDEVLVDEDDRPTYEIKILKTIILVNPFADIVPRVQDKPRKEEIKPKESKKKDQGIKNYQLLSFGEEAEEDDLETEEEARKYEGKSKSTHDILNDPKLSSQTIMDMKTHEDEELAKQVEAVKVKLSKKSRNDQSKPEAPKSEDPKTDDISDDDNYFESQREKDKNKKLESIRSEIKNLKREYREEQKSKRKEDEPKKKKIEKSEELITYEEEQKKYVDLKKQIWVKGSARENFAWSLLEKFKDKMASARTLSPNSTAAEAEEEQEQDEEAVPLFTDCINRQLQSNTKQVLAKDANTKSDDWYEIFDPRNPINKRRRETSKQEINERRKAKYELK